MARPRIIEDAELLGIARKIFVRAGVSGSTKEIAREAKISEAALFKRYPTKATLFLAAMAPPNVDAAEIIREASQRREPRQALIIIAERVLDYFRRAIPLMLPIITHPRIGLDPLLKQLGQNPAPALRREIMWYLHGEAKHGHVSKASCEAAAHLLVSSLHGIALFESIGFHREALPKAGVTPLVDALWQGLRPENSRERKSR
jgi:AcrR family transcriptional regulator